jgi:hypothetical protein
MQVWKIKQQTWPEEKKPYSLSIARPKNSAYQKPKGASCLMIEKTSSNIE